MLDVRAFRSFSSVLKEAGFFPNVLKGAKEDARVAKGILKGIKGRDLVVAGTGAGSLYGGHRLLQDVKSGEQIRKQQKQLRKQQGY